MLDIYFCIRDQHDWRLIVLAGLICAASTIAAVLLLRHDLPARPRERRRWLATAGIATGFGIWATHFVAMLGFDPGIVVGYGAGLTAASLLVAIAMTVAGLTASIREGRLVRPWAGGATIGAGIAAMHYMGMSAVEMPGRFAWSAPYVIASIGFAILPTVLALRLAVRPSGRRSAIAAGLLLALAILLLHFTGMTAVTVIPDAREIADGPVLTPISLGVAIATTALAVMALCVGAALLSARTRAAIRIRDREFHILVQGISDCAIYMLDPHGRVASWNAGAERLKGYAAAEAIGLPPDHFHSAEDRAAGLAATAMARARADGRFATEGWRHRKDGSRFWAHVTVESVHDEAGALRGFAKITRDMTRYKQDQDRLAELTGNLDAALSNMLQGLCLFDADERLILANARAGAIFGLSSAACPPGTSFRDALGLALAVRDGRSVPDAMLDEVHERHRACLEKPEGRRIVVDFSAGCTLSVAHRPMPGGGWVSTFEDITETRRSEARIAHMALHDELTGLPNRAYFTERLDSEILQARRSGTCIAVFVIDLDRFKEINDTRGHAAGDEVLRLLSARMTDALAADEFVARLGGDEFAAFRTYADKAEIAEFAGRLQACFDRDIAVDGIETALGASIGIATFPGDGATREQVFNNADLAMYRAKATLGQQICYYEQGMDEAARARRMLGNDLREAIRRNEFALAYQVQRSVPTGAVTGYEALLRWNHPRLGWVPPAEFIPIAEETGEILRIGEWVLRTACADAAGWTDPVKVAVNLSPVQLMNVKLIDQVQQVLIDTGLSPARLELEITESAVVADKARALHILRRIKAMGVTIAIDDFGTGYSSLDTLNSFPFDKIKIDRSFLIESDASPQARAIIRAVLALGRSLEVPVLAEGLETEAQLDLLRSEGCDEAQGYLFGRPELARGGGEAQVATIS